MCGCFFFLSWSSLQTAEGLPEERPASSKALPPERGRLKQAVPRLQFSSGMRVSLSFQSLCLFLLLDESKLISRHLSEHSLLSLCFGRHLVALGGNFWAGGARTLWPKVISSGRPSSRKRAPSAPRVCLFVQTLPKAAPNWQLCPFGRPTVAGAYKCRSAEIWAGRRRAQLKARAHNTLRSSHTHTTRSVFARCSPLAQLPFVHSVYYTYTLPRAHLWPARV